MSDVLTSSLKLNLFIKGFLHALVRSFSSIFLQNYANLEVQSGINIPSLS